MASLTQEQARLEMLEMLKTAWDAGPVSPVPVMLYDHNSEGDFAPGVKERWARAVVDPNIRGDAALGGELFRTEGFLKVQIFVPKNDGMTNMMALAKVILDAFEGQHSPNGIWFRKCRYRNSQSDEPAWFMGLVFVEYQFDEIKT